jgi:hypothetical protein
VVATTTILLAAASLTKMSAGAAEASNAAARVPALVKAKTLEVSAAATAFEQDSEVVAMLATEVSATEKGHETEAATS